MIDFEKENNPEIRANLKAKINLFISNPDESQKMEVISELLQHLINETVDSLESVRVRKAQEKGGFTQGIYLDEVKFNDNTSISYDKLVRDHIPEIIVSNTQEKGGLPITHIVEGGELKKCLEAKLFEEMEEFIQTPSIEEAADILEVMNALIV